MLEELFSPFKIGPVEMRNRIVMPSMITFLASEVGAVTQRMIDYYAERARGGVGLINIESVYVLEEDRDFGRLGIENPRLQVGLSELAESIQEQGARSFLQLNHRGSALSIHKGKGPDELTLEEMEGIIEAFSLAALRAQKAGFDGVEIHGANIYLIAQFLSPLTNHRRDEYGGGLEGRMKFLKDVFQRVRQKVGDEYPVSLRMAGHEYTDGGLQLTDTQFIARRMEEAGASALHVSAGSPVVPYWHVPPMAIARGCHVKLAAEIRKVVKIPVIAVGRINDPVLANEVVAEGKADLVAMGRALIADPYLPLKAKEGRLEDIRKCVACNYCRKRIGQLNRTLRCAVNAEAGRERDSRIVPSSRNRRVMVIGGGPAGMEAARVLALRGHRVVLYEKGAKLGGQVNLAVIPPHKEELGNILDYLPSQLKKLNVEVHLGREATAETVTKERPDAIIVATGALSLFPEIPGLERGKTVHSRGSPGRGSANGRKDHHPRRRNGGVRGGRVSGRQRKAGHHHRKALRSRFRNGRPYQKAAPGAIEGLVHPDHYRGRGALPPGEKCHPPESRKNHRGGNRGDRSGYGSQGRPHLRGISDLADCPFTLSGIAQKCGT